MTDLLLMRTALRESLRPRRLLIATLLTLLPAGIGLTWRLLAGGKDFDPGDVYDSLVVGLVFSFSLTILSVVYGTGVVAQELEQRTIVYLLTRPLPRWRILLAKFLVSLAVVAAVAVLSALLLALAVFGPSGFTQAEVGQDLRALLVGALAYGSVFLLVGAALPRPLTWGLLLVFGWETWVPKLPGSFTRLSVMTYLRVLAAREVAPDAETAAAQAGDNILLAFARPPDLEISSQSALMILLTVSAVALLASLLVFSNRQYVPREDAE
jgi:ABC-type transport system involved in multi-copper enzyme maturation, permease component